ncbi:MAG: DUF3368 domain-containing protein [Ignavibacteriae bacterium]|nr:DUF3368 domain-containing protein [Ignavibacteriota bacterium]
MQSVISDSSTLIHLSRIGRLGLLRDLFTRVVVPSAVWREVVLGGKGRTGAAELETAFRAGWIEPATPTNTQLLRLLSRDLDEGESEVIALGLERESSLLLLDETDARQVAERYDLSKTGTIGVLMRAKHEGKIISLREELDKLRIVGGFWIEGKLIEQALRAVGE